MPASPLQLPASTAAEDPAPYPDDWSETCAMTVACTMDPTCALAFCFGNFWGRRSATPAPASPRKPRFKWLMGA
ncbi:hypothetical protein [Pelomonas sp. KK5]|uniref:hypothetical protein n=1 Tax=Pelomonas sp. KK5 TaxID=1855730 RepID=UPI00117F00D4|nr:hypothetical protein [Pelomonas sp. KK5]